MTKDSCSICGASVARVPASAPAIVCRACREAKRKTSNAPPPGKCGTCAACGCLMWRGKDSLPQGEATCLACRRAKVKRKFRSELRQCARCSGAFEATRSDQKYCVPCRGKRRGFGKTQRPSASQRGYGAAHQRERARWKVLVEAGEARCCLCYDPIEPGSDWHLDHTPDRTAYRGAAHADCNRRDGARRGRARQEQSVRNREW